MHVRFASWLGCRLTSLLAHMHCKILRTCPAVQQIQDTDKLFTMQSNIPTIKHGFSYFILESGINLACRKIYHLVILHMHRSQGDLTISKLI